jgi:hypothetical protein
LKFQFKWEYNSILLLAIFDRYLDTGNSFNITVIVNGYLRPIRKFSDRFADFLSIRSSRMSSNRSQPSMRTHILNYDVLSLILSYLNLKEKLKSRLVSTQFCGCIEYQFKNQMKLRVCVKSNKRFEYYQSKSDATGNDFKLKEIQIKRGFDWFLRHYIFYSTP